MDTKKLDKWADLLLDTGKRNNLINFKDTRASTVEVLLPSSDVLFEKVDGTASFEVFDPKIVEEDDDTEESYAPEQLQIGAPEESSEPEQLQIGTPEEFSEPDQLQIEMSEKSDASGGKAAFLAQYSGKIKRQLMLCLFLNSNFSVRFRGNRTFPCTQGVANIRNDILFICFMAVEL